VPDYILPASPAIAACFQDKGAAVTAALQNTSTRTGYHHKDLASDPLYQEYGVVSEELGQRLEVQGRLHYRVLTNTPHGRHLLMVTLLEELGRGRAAWEARCLGRLQLFLPPRLRPEGQPDDLPEGAIMLQDIFDPAQGNKTLTRNEVTRKFREIVPRELHKSTNPSDLKLFVFYSRAHRSALSLLVEWALRLDFSSSLSLLVTLQDLAAPDLYMELVMLTIMGRADCGLVLPLRESITPELYFTEVVAQLEEDNWTIGEDNWDDGEYYHAAIALLLDDSSSRDEDNLIHVDGYDQPRLDGYDQPRLDGYDQPRLDGYDQPRRRTKRQAVRTEDWTNRRNRVS
jgi:hypothetical protein